MRRVFLAFAVEDEQGRNLFRGQALNPRNDIEFIDMSVYDAWAPNTWKAACRLRIRSCSRFIALLSRDSLSATGQRWEITCAKEEGVPILGVYLVRTDTSAPPEMAGQHVIYWDQSEIAKFING